MHAALKVTFGEKSVAKKCKTVKERGGYVRKGWRLEFLKTEKGGLKEANKRETRKALDDYHAEKNGSNGSLDVDA